MTMRRLAVLRPLALAAVLFGPGISLAADSVVEEWALGLWNAARMGDADRLERRFDELPAERVAEESVERFRASLAQLRLNRSNAIQSREEHRTKALEAMRAELEESHLSKALAKAVEAQTYSEDLNSAFDDPEIMKLAGWAVDRVAEAERDRSWLEAQELLYLLRTFYDDTDRRDEFQRFDEHLTRVNRRVALLAQYVPRRLHEMRNDRAEREGDEAFGEFNPATAVDWRERLRGVEHRMLKQALRVAAAEHIETKGWRPLLEGGLASLRLLATTTALSTTFPDLSDAVAVVRWVHKLDEIQRTLEAVPDGDLDHWTLNDLLDDLVLQNKQTIKIPIEVLLREFGDGALDALDTYSEVIWPDKLRRFQQATAGNFVGVGILIRHNDKREIMVVNPLEGTPAYFEGVKPNDLILEVNGDSTVGWSLNDAVDRITGPKGTTVRLGLGREEVEGLVEIPIVRDVIKIRSVKGWWKENLDQGGEPVWDWFIDPDSRIAYIRLTQFTEDSYDDLRHAWREINAGGRPNGFILDLRHNPGGLLTAAVQISNLFISKGAIVTGEDKDGNQAWVQNARRHQAEFAGVPTVVLVNRGSASASEIVSGCLQAHGAAVIVGERSFGKGSVQTIHHIATSARLKLTTQYYRLPPVDGQAKGRLVHKRPGAEEWGVDPDIEVAMTVKQVTKAIQLRQKAETIPIDENGQLNPDDPARPDVRGLLTDGIDPQLETALLLLQARALGTGHERHARGES